MDAYAWIEYMDGSAKGRAVGEKVETPEHEILTSAVTVAEVVSKHLRRAKDPARAVNAMSTNSRVVPVSQELAEMAGELHAHARKTMPDFGLADAFVLATARTSMARILTADPHFQDYPEAEII